MTTVTTTTTSTTNAGVTLLTRASPVISSRRRGVGGGRGGSSSSNPSMMPSSSTTTTISTTTTSMTTMTTTQVRIPTVLYITGNGIITAGLAGAIHPVRAVDVAIPMMTTMGNTPTTTTTTTTTTSSSHHSYWLGCMTRTAPEWYRCYAPAIRNVLELLAVSNDIKDRRVVVILDMGMGGSTDYHGWWPSTLQEALERILMTDIGVPACCFQSVLSTIPMAIPFCQNQYQTPSTTSSDPPIPPSMLVLHVTLQWGIHCVAVVDGQALGYTYQSCCHPNHPAGEFITTDSLLSIGTSTVHELYRQQLSWLDGTTGMMTCTSDAPPQNENSDHNDTGHDQQNELVRALLRCIESCPRQARRSIVQNLFVTGMVIDNSQWSIRVARALKQALVLSTHTKPTTAAAAAPVSRPGGDDITSTTETVTTTHDTIAEATSISSIRGGVVHHPIITWSELYPLADHVAVLHIPTLRPDWIPWLGASGWVAHWHAMDPEQFSWIFGRNNNQS